MTSRDLHPRTGEPLALTSEEMGIDRDYVLKNMERNNWESHPRATCPLVRVPFHAVPDDVCR